MTTAVVRETKRLSPHGTGKDAGRAALHERQVAYVRASLLRGISYEHSGEPGPRPVVTDG